MNNLSNINEFISAISKPILPKVFNPWAQVCEMDIGIIGHIARRGRLLKHLNCKDPRLVIIGEAPGYQGCRYSGIAFTSERLIGESKIPRVSVPDGMRLTSRKKPWSEPSATIVWGQLHELGIADNTVMFNAFPWHPIGPNGDHSNRTPTSKEKDIGKEYLFMFLELFPNVNVVALGGTAHQTLTKLKVDHTEVRHPAYGGANQCRLGLAELIKKTNIFI